MKKLITALFATLLLISCNKIQGEGPILTSDYELSDGISSIRISAAMSLELSEDIAPGTIQIETYSNLFQYLRVKQQGHVLNLLLENNKYKGDLKIKIYASSAQYDSVAASGASTVVLRDEIQSPEYRVDLSGASRFYMERAADELTYMSILASGASYARVAGSASKLVVDCSGSSSVNGDSFECDELNVQLSGASGLSVGIRESASGNLSGASKLNYRGHANVNVSTSGSSKIHHDGEL